MGPHWMVVAAEFAIAIPVPKDEDGDHVDEPSANDSPVLPHRPKHK